MDDMDLDWYCEIWVIYFQTSVSPKISSDYFSRKTYNPQSRQDGSLWSSFESPFDEYVHGNEDKSNQLASLSDADANVAFYDGEAWLDALASIAAEEINFIQRRGRSSW